MASLVNECSNVTHTHTHTQHTQLLETVTSHSLRTNVESYVRPDRHCWTIST